jgi:hypothetical protein
VIPGKQNAIYNVGWYVVIPVACILIIFSTYFLETGVFIGASQDTLSNIIRYVFLEQNLFAKWNNQWIMGGFPEIASPFSDRYYPLSFPFYYFTKSIYILNFVILLHLFIAYFSSLKLGSLISRERYLVTIGALFYTFSGILMSRVSVGQNYYIFALAWLPLFYYFFLVIVWKHDIRLENFAFLIIIAILMFFSGGLYYFVFSLMLTGIFLLFYILRKKIAWNIGIALFISMVVFLMLVSFKLIPDFFVSGNLIRLDPIDPLSGGGFIEKGIASFAFGMPIENFYGVHESMAFLGLVPCIFITIGFIFGDRNLTIPAFLTMIFSFIWAAGSNSVLSFIHLMPFLDTLRCPGRIFGAILPILVLLLVYGIHLTLQCIHNERSIQLDASQKKGVVLALGILFLVKLLELPAQSEISLISVCAVTILCIFICLLYLNKMTPTNLILFLAVSAFFSLFMALSMFNIVRVEIMVKILLIGVIMAGLLLYSKNVHNIQKKALHLKILILFALLLTIAVNISYIAPVQAGLETGPAKEVAAGLSGNASPNHQIWILETGWPYMHLDFTYWDTKYNMAPFTGYYAYYLNDHPSLVYELEGKAYSSVDYLVDTKQLENGQQNIPEYSFSLSGIGIQKPGLVLPNAFVIRENRFVTSKIMKLTPDSVALAGDFKKGDVAILKSAYYPGWDVNGKSGMNINNLVGSPLIQDTQEIVFTFDPPDFKIGCIISALGVAICGILFVYRKKAVQFLSLAPPKKMQQ